MFRIKPISISLSPNVQWDDVWLAVKLLVTTPFPSFVRRGVTLTPTQLLEQRFEKYLGVKYAFSFNSGRSALYTILKAIDIKIGDEVFLQAFTCNAVPNPVLWAGGMPIYVDIDDALNIDPEDLERKINDAPRRGGKPRAVIIQNTFGIPAQIDKICEIAKRHNLLVIEDCAHALGAEYKGKKLGTFGDVAFFSFGRDKVISSVWGGIVTTNNAELGGAISALVTLLPLPLSYSKRGGGVKDVVLSENVSTRPPSLNVREGAGGVSYNTPSKIWTIKQLLHPILFAVIIPTYYIFGKYLLAFLRIVRGVGLAVSQSERRGEKPDMFPARMPEALAELALHQFNKLEMYNAHRREIAELYFTLLYNSPHPPLTLRGGMQHNVQKVPPLRVRGGKGELQFPKRIPGAIYLRFNIHHHRAKEIIASAKKKHILLGDWYKNVIDPIGTDFAAMKYTPGSCPKAELAARESINLPTHINISKKDACEIVNFLKHAKYKSPAEKSTGDD